MSSLMSLRKMESSTALLTVTLCVYMSAFLTVGSAGFQFHVSETSPSNRLLRCTVNANISSEDIFTVIGLTIFDVTNETKVKLASISALDTHPNVDQARKDFINVQGAVSQHHANLAVILSNQTSCTVCTYLCEMKFINSDGVPVLRERMSEVKNESGAANQFVSAVNEVKEVLDVIQASQVLFTHSVETKLDKIAGLLATVVDRRKPDQCYKGMATLYRPPRILITVLGNKTALCDTITDGGGWIVFQRRTSDVVDFYRNWTSYRTGFGNAQDGDYWLGLDAIHQITWTGTFELRIDMVFHGKKYYAQYSSFYIGDLETKYTLSIDGYSGDAGDSMAYHNNMKFTTQDMDLDKYPEHNCAVAHHGAWWFNRCRHSHLNGAWGSTNNLGIKWKLLGTGLTFTEMKMRLVM